MENRSGEIFPDGDSTYGKENIGKFDLLFYIVVLSDVGRCVAPVRVTRGKFRRHGL